MTSAAIRSQEALMIELIRQALGKIARQAATWPPQDVSEEEIIEAVTDASEALEALEQTLEARGV